MSESSASYLNVDGNTKKTESVSTLTVEEKIRIDMALPDSQLYGGEAPVGASNPPVAVKEETKDPNLHDVQGRNVGGQEDRPVETRGSFGEGNPFHEEGVEETKGPDLEDLDAEVGVQESSRGRDRLERRHQKKKEEGDGRRTSRRSRNRKYYISGSSNGESSEDEDSGRRRRHHDEKNDDAKQHRKSRNKKETRKEGSRKRSGRRGSSVSEDAGSEVDEDRRRAKERKRRERRKREMEEFQEKLDRIQGELDESEGSVSSEATSTRSERRRRSGKSKKGRRRKKSKRRDGNESDSSESDAPSRKKRLQSNTASFPKLKTKQSETTSEDLRAFQLRVKTQIRNGDGNTEPSKMVEAILISFEEMSFYPNAKTMVRDTQLEWDQVYDMVDLSGDRKLKEKTKRDERKALLRLCYDLCDLITTDTIGARTVIEVLDKVRNVRMVDCAATVAEVNVLAFLTYFRNLVYTLEITDYHWKLEMNRLFYLALTETLQEEISTRLPPADKRFDLNATYEALQAAERDLTPYKLSRHQRQLAEMARSPGAALVDKSNQDKNKKKKTVRADGEAHATERQGDAKQRPLCCWTCGHPHNKKHSPCPKDKPIDLKAIERSKAAYVADGGTLRETKNQQANTATKAKAKPKEAVKPKPKSLVTPPKAESAKESESSDEESDDEGNLNVAIRDKGKNRKRTWNPKLDPELLCDIADRDHRFHSDRRGPRTMTDAESFGARIQELLGIDPVEKSRRKKEKNLKGRKGAIFSFTDAEIREFDEDFDSDDDEDDSTLLPWQRPLFQMSPFLQMSKIEGDLESKKGGRIASLEPKQPVRKPQRAGWRDDGKYHYTDDPGYKPEDSQSIDWAESLKLKSVRKIRTRVRP